MDKAIIGKKIGMSQIFYCRRQGHSRNGRGSRSLPGRADKDERERRL